MTTANRAVPEWLRLIPWSMRQASSGAVSITESYEFGWPHVGTSLRIVDLRSARPMRDGIAVGPGAFELADTPPHPNPQVLAPDEQTLEILAALSLNKSELAEVLGVSRPTLYDWLNGGEPNIQNARRLNDLIHLLQAAGITSATPLGTRFVRRPLGDHRKPLLGVLIEDAWDRVTLSRHLHEARTLSNQVQSRRERREARLRKLGFDEQSRDQRVEQLNRNVSMRDWPKTD